MANMELAFGFVTDPANSMFKEVKNMRAIAEHIYCSLPECPLRAKGQCTYSRPLLWDDCPYGRKRRTEGPTRNARKYRAWRQEQIQALNGAIAAENAPERMAFIDEYVYLPYAHMDFIGTKQDYGARRDSWIGGSDDPPIPWLVPAAFWGKSCQFIPRTAWTLDTVLQLLKGRPQAWLGGEITGYQEKSVPKFLQHLPEEDPAMWAQLIAVRPDLDKPPVHVGRKALLTTLRPGIQIPAHSQKYPVVWMWTGDRLITIDKDAYNSVWGHIPGTLISMELQPAKGATVVVAAEDWVLPTTIFVD